MDTPTQICTTCKAPETNNRTSLPPCACLDGYYDTELSELECQSKANIINTLKSLFYFFKRMFRSFEFMSFV